MAKSTMVAAITAGILLLATPALLVPAAPAAPAAPASQGANLRPRQQQQGVNTDNRYATSILGSGEGAFGNPGGNGGAQSGQVDFSQNPWLSGIGQGNNNGPAGNGDSWQGNNNNNWPGNNGNDWQGSNNNNNWPGNNGNNWQGNNNNNWPGNNGNDWQGNGNNWGSNGGPDGSSNNNNNNGGQSQTPQGNPDRNPSSINGVRPPSTARPECGCITTAEYNPICGTDGVTYENPSRLRCARVCGSANSIQQKHTGACTSPPPSR